jgi:membrane protease YdiL (CAAX protease family)
MLDELMLIGATALGLIILGFGIGLADRRNFHFGWLAVAALLVIVNDAAVTRGFFSFRGLPGFDANSDWNWSGKILALAVSLAIAALPVFGWRNIGLTLRQHQLRGALIVTVVLLVIYSTMAWFMGAGGGTRGELAFQLTMPGFEEEVFYRGLLLLALDRVFTGRLNIGGAAIGWSLPLNALVFGLAHGLSVDHGVFGFNALAFALPCIGTIPAVWLRSKTGSLVLPVVLHNVVNVLFVVLPL